MSLPASISSLITRGKVLAARTLVQVSGPTLRWRIRRFDAPMVATTDAK
jgi:hypothetical protein